MLFVYLLSFTYTKSFSKVIFWRHVPLWLLVAYLALPLSLYAKTEDIELSYKDHFFVQLIELDAAHSPKNQYAYKLEGIDEDWIYCGSRPFASYTNLSPGKYVFRVKQLNNEGAEIEKTTSILITIHPPFWRTGWFGLLSAGLLFSTAFVFYKYRKKHQARHMTEIERVRMLESKRIQRRAACNFHDGLGQESTKISLYSAIISRHGMGNSPVINEYINKIRIATKSLDMGMRDFNWLLDPAKDSLYECTIYLKDFGDELFEKTGITFAVMGITHELENIKIPMEYRKQSTWIFKERMVNILKHSLCSHVLLEIALNAPNIVIRLSDDGQPGDKDMHFAENGLRAMKMRAQKIHGELNVISKPDQGTTIEFVGQLEFFKNDICSHC